MSGFNQVGIRAEQTYEFQDVLGKGNFSTVYRGAHRVTGDPVALKVLLAEGYRNDDRKKQLIRNEVAIMADVKRINHDHLMKFHHIYEDTAKIVMVLEYLGGGELFDRIVSRGHYSEKDASKAIRVLMEALHVMHQNGLLHRDIKPENIVYATTNNDSPLKLSDFGLSAKLPPNCTMIRDRNLCGTPTYIAPEVIRGHIYSPAADIWSAGVILYILLAGVQPFYGRTHNEIFEKIKQGKWHFISKFESISAEAKDLVRKMLTHDLRQRITYEEFMQHPWIQKWDENSDVHLKETVEELDRFNGKRRFRAVAMATIATNRLKKGLLSMAVNAKQTQETEQLLQKDAFTKDEISKLKDEFEKVAGEKGSLTLAQFRQVMSSLQLGHLPVDRIFEMFDTDGNGDLDYKEFLLGISKFNLTGDDALKFCFQVMDEDKSGTLTREELTKVLVQLYHAREDEDRLGHEGESEDDTMMEMELETTATETATTSAPNSTLFSTSGPPGQNPPISPPSNNLHFFPDGNTPSALDSSNASDEIFDATKSPIPIKSPQNGREMDASTYELLESIATLFDDLDANNDNVITLEEFTEGCKRHPEVMALFFNHENADANGDRDPSGESQTHNRSNDSATLLNTSFRSSTGKFLG